MPKLPLTLAIGEYDHVRDLVEGRVAAEGIDLSSLVLPIEEIFFRFLRFQEWDISEMSMGRYVSLLSRNESAFVGIPVFPSRTFRHSAIYVRRDRGIKRPEDLRGKRVGIPEWAQTAGIYVRGFLKHEFSIEASEIEWVQAGVHNCGRMEEVNVTPPEGVVITRVTDDTLSNMLTSGDIDAAVSAHPPHYGSNIGQLFDRAAEAEKAYWRATGIFPIMHLILLRRETFERHPWVAMNMLTAFEVAKVRSLSRAAERTASRYPLPWMSDYVRQTQELFGDDYWPYGVEKNRRTIEAFLQYAFEQGVSARKLNVHDLFPPEVRENYLI